MATLRTVTIKASGGDYTTWAAMAAAETKDLVTADRKLRVELYASAAPYPKIDLAAEAWITSATCELEVVAPVGERHSGTWNTSKVRFVSAAAVYGEAVIKVAGSQHVHLDSVQVESTSVPSLAPRGIYHSGSGTGRLRVSRPILRSTGGSDTYEDGVGILSDTTGACTLILLRPLVIDFSVGIQKLGYTTVASTYLIYNPTVIGARNATGSASCIDLLSVDSPATLRVKNAVLQKASGANACWAGGSGTTDYVSILTNDTSSPHAGLRSKTVTFVGSGDYTPASGDTNAKDAGTDLSADSYLAHNTDLRDGVITGTWDLGALEYGASTSVVIESATSGDWDDGSTWVGGVVPTAPNRARIMDGHTVTGPVGYTIDIGSSPADDTGDPAIETDGVDGTGVCIFNGTLIFRGPLRMGAASWSAGAGATLTHDSSDAAVPATANYTIQVGQSDAASNIFNLNGIVGSPITLDIGAGSGPCGGFTWSGSYGSSTGQVYGEHGVASDWGTSTMAFASATLFSSGKKLAFENWHFDNCGRIAALEVFDGADHYLENVTYVNPAGVHSWGHNSGANGARINPTTGRRGLKNVYIEGMVTLFAYTAGPDNAGYEFDGNITLAGRTDAPPLYTIGGMEYALWNEVLLYNRVTGSGGPGQAGSGQHDRTILLRETASGNPHWIDDIKFNVTYDGVVVEALNSGSSGDVFQTSSSSGFDATVLVKNLVAIPTAAGDPIGSILTHSITGTHNGTTVRFPSCTLEHSTFKVLDTSDCNGVGGENNDGKAGLYKVRSNMVYRSASGAGNIVKWVDSRVATMVAGSHVDCDYNGYYNVTGERYKGLGSNPSAFSGTTGTHDVNANPNFVDDSRRFLTWGQSLDGSLTTWAGVIAKMRDCVKGLNTTFTVAACYNWIMSGWYASNSALHGTAHDGGNIGIAQLFVGGSSSSSGPRFNGGLFF